jgi:hypothetical protein
MWSSPMHRHRGIGRCCLSDRVPGHCPVGRQAPIDVRRWPAEPMEINVRASGSVTRRWMHVAIVTGLLGVAALAAAIATPGVHRTPMPPPSLPIISNRSNGPASGVVPPSLASGVPTSLRDAWLVATIVFVVAAILAVFLLWNLIVIRRRPLQRFMRDRDGTPEPLSIRGHMIGALDDGIARLAGDSDARSAIIACWVRLESVGDAAGIPRRLSDAPADLTARLLGAHQVSRPALRSLADLYREARSITKPIDNPMRELALSALSTVRAEIAASEATSSAKSDTPPSVGVRRRP